MADGSMTNLILDLIRFRSTEIGAESRVSTKFGAFSSCFLEPDQCAKC